jgi:hypothetical protein
VAVIKVLSKESPIFGQFSEDADRIIAEVKIEVLTFLLDEMLRDYKALLNKDRRQTDSIVVWMNA